MKIGILMGLDSGKPSREQTAQVHTKYTLQAVELYPKLILTPQSQTYLSIFQMQLNT